MTTLSLRAFHLPFPIPAADVHALASAQGWPLIQETARVHYQHHRLIWRTPSDGELHYYEDHLYNARFVLLVAATPDGLESLDSVVRSALPVAAGAELVSKVDTASSPSDIVAAVLALASYLSSTPPGSTGDRDERLPAIAERLVAHESRNVRRAVIIGFADPAAGWPELAAPILARRGADPDLDHVLDAFTSVVTPTP